MAGGAAGGMSGDYLDSVRKGEDFDIRQGLVTGITGGAAGGFGAGARAIDGGLDGMARGLKNENDFTYSTDRPEHQQAGIDAAFDSSTPIAGGVSANTAKDGFDGMDKSAGEAQKAAERGVEGNHQSATDRIREDFG